MKAARIQVVLLVTLLALAGCNCGPDQSPGSTTRPDKDAMRARSEALALVSKLVGGYSVPPRPTPHEAITHVVLSKTAVTDDDLKVIAGLGYVQHLDLSETGITDQGVQHLTLMKRLDSLQLSKTKVTAEGLRHLLRVPGLTHLNVAGTAVQESDLAIFAGHIPTTDHFGGFVAARAWMMPGPFDTSDWVVAPDGKLSLRLLAPQALIVRQAPLVVLVELRNDSREAINVLRPCGDQYLADASWVKCEGFQGPIKYSGPARSYKLGGAAFETIRPGQTIRDVMVLPVWGFDGSDRAGKYRITFQYQPSSSHQQTATGLGIDREDLWTGQVQSKAVIVHKE